MGGCVGNKKERTILLINIFLYSIPSQVSNPPKIPLTENSTIPSIPIFLYPSLPLQFLSAVIPSNLCSEPTGRESEAREVVFGGASSAG